MTPDLDFDILFDRVQRAAAQKASLSVALYLISQDVVSGAQTIQQSGHWNPIIPAESRFDGFSFEISMNSYLLLTQGQHPLDVSRRHQEMSRLVTEATKEAVMESPEFISAIVQRIVEGKPSDRYTVVERTGQSVRPEADA